MPGVPLSVEPFFIEPFSTAPFTIRAVSPL